MTDVVSRPQPVVSLAAEALNDDFLRSLRASFLQQPAYRVAQNAVAQHSGDAGQWNMFVSLIKKHGLVPKACMPETESSSNTARMNTVLRMKLREGASRLRDLIAGGAAADALRDVKHAYLQAIYCILSIHL